MSKQTETLDKLYLEWSQFTQAKTSREVQLENFIHLVMPTADIEASIIGERLVELQTHKWPLAEAKKRIAELEKVAQAAVVYRGYFCELETHSQREPMLHLDQALRAAGYLQEQGE